MPRSLFEMPVHDRAERIAIFYRSHAYAKWRFRARYCAYFDDYESHVDEQGFETCWELYVGICNRIRWENRPRRQVERSRDPRVQGWTVTGIYTTNGQRAQSLAKRGRPRCRRTVQRQLRRLEALGLVHRKHIVKSGPAAIPGKLDCLALATLNPGPYRPRNRKVAMSPPPLRGDGVSLRSPPENGATTAREQICSTTIETRGPPPPASTPTDVSEENGMTAEEREAEAIARFRALKRQMGWGPFAAKARPEAGDDG